MSTCRCQTCSTDPLPTWMPEFRIACEARWLLSKPLTERREYLASPMVKTRSDDLKAAMVKAHNSLKCCI